MSKTRNIILMLDSSRAVDRDIIRGIVRYSHLRGNWSFARVKPLFQTPPFTSGQSDTILQRLTQLDADGLIGYLPPDLQPNIIQRQFPAVVIPVQQLIQGVVNIQQDPQVGILGAEYFLNQGLRHLAFCGTRDRWSDIRQQAFSQRIHQAGLDVTVFALPSTTDRDDELNDLQHWLTTLPQPVGIMASNDERAQDVIEAAAQAGLSIPDQVAVLGVDNDEMICTLTNPPLSSIPLNADKVGYQAAKILNRLIDGEAVDCENIRFEPAMVVTRHSTDALAMEDPHVAQAVRFIRNNARLDIHVTDVVNQSSLSIRALQQRFRQAMDRSINQEIRRVRIQHLAETLLASNQTIGQVCVDLGFKDIHHISRLFKQEMGMTPLAYRQQYGQYFP